MRRDRDLYAPEFWWDHRRRGGRRLRHRYARGVCNSPGGGGKSMSRNDRQSTPSDMAEDLFHPGDVALSQPEMNTFKNKLATFMDLSFRLGPNVLAPRKETELLAKVCIERLSKGPARPRVIDMCCGCGNLAIAIAHQIRDADVWACDLTDETVLAELAVKPAIHRCEWRDAMDRGRVPETHALARRLLRKGWHGVVYPSFMSPGGSCVALWRWNDKEAPHLDVIDPEHRLPRSPASWL